MSNSILSRRNSITSGSQIHPQLSHKSATTHTISEFSQSFSHTQQHQLIKPPTTQHQQYEHNYEDNAESVADTEMTSPEQMTIDKNTLKRYAKEWIQLVDTIDPIKKQLRQMEAQKKELEKYITHFMETHQKAVVKSAQIGGGIERVRGFRRAPITRDHIVECLLKFQEDEERAVAITTDIFDSRKRIETSRLKRVQLSDIDTIAVASAATGPE
jgi:hypothetical protein